MINRYPIECCACGRRVVTRTAIGHGNLQTHSFPCEGCGVVITYRLTLDQEKVTFDYDPDPTNGRWLDSEDGCAAEVVFDPETLGIRDGPPISTPSGNPPPPGMPQRFSPFIENFHRFRDYRAFMKEQSTRFIAIRSADAIDRLITHFEKQNWALFDTQMKELGVENPTSSIGSRILNLRALLVDHQEQLIKENRQTALTIYHCFRDALKRNSALVDQFCSEYRTSNRLYSVWRQLTAFRKDFLAKTYYMIPLLQRSYWKPPIPDLDDCVIYNKQFGELKALYIDGFELLARLTVPFLALTGIAQRGTTDVPTRKGAMDIWAFEKLANANKQDHLVGTSGKAVFTPYLDTLLRNGVGHNSAHYDASADAVVLYKQQGAALDEFNYSYTKFVDCVLSLCSTLLEADALVFHLLERTEVMIR